MHHCYGYNAGAVSIAYKLPKADIVEMKKYTFKAKMKLVDATSDVPYFVYWDVADRRAIYYGLLHFRICCEVDASPCKHFRITPSFSLVMLGV